MNDYAEEFGPEFRTHILAVMARVPGFTLKYRSALDHTYFVDEANRAIAKVLLEHSLSSHDLPTRVTLIEMCKPVVGKSQFPAVTSRIGELFKQDVSDAPKVMDMAVEFGKTQAMINAVIKAGERIDGGNRNVRELIDAASLVGQDLSDLGLNFHTTFEERALWYTSTEEQMDTVRTGIVHMDLMLNGGLGRGELGVILAPPKRGKSTTLVNIGFGALSSVSGLTCVHYSCEMGQKKVIQRYDDRLMGNRVKFKKSEPQKYIAQLEQRLKLVQGRLIVKSYPTRSATPSALRSHLSLLASQGVYPDVAIVDYADIMKPERRLGEMRHEQAGIYEDLRAIAGEFNLALWTASQTNKSGLTKETVTMEDFAEAFEKAAIVDAAFGFCQTDEERIDSRARLFAAALRNAEDARTIEVFARRDCCLIESTGILDAAGSPMKGSVTTKTTTVDAVKKKVGLTKKAPVKKKVFTKKKASSGITKKKLSKKPTADLAGML